MQKGLLFKYVSLLVVAAFVAPFTGSLSQALASSGYAISVTSTTVSGLVLSVGGTVSAHPYVGTQAQQHVRVTNWGDASATTDATTSLTFGGSGNSKFFDGTWSTTHTYASSGTYSVTVVVCHQNCSGNDESDLGTQTFSVVIPTVNEAPVLSNVPTSATIPEEAAYSFTASATDTNGGTLTFSLSGAPAGATIDGTSGVFSWTPTETQGGTSYTFSVVVTDPSSLTDTQEVTLTVSEVNKAPVATNTSATTQMNTAKNITLPATDADDPIQTLTFSVVSNPANGTVSISGDIATYTPGQDFTGSDSFTFKVNDGSADSETKTVTVTINNESPSITPITDKSVNEESLLSITPTATDPNEDTLTFELGGPSKDESGISFNTSTGVFSWTPTETQDGTYTFTISVTDGSATDSTTFNVTVNEVNNAPSGEDTSKTTDEDTAVDISLTGTDTDIPVQTLTFSVLDNPLHGTVAILDNVATYTPALNYNGSDSFTFIVSDDLTDSLPKTVSLTVNPVNDAPTIALVGLATLTLTQGDTFTDPGATVTDIEDTNPTATTTGSVNTSTPGNYTLTYSYTDSGEVTVTVTRTVIVQEGQGGGNNETPAACNDGIDNDEDGLIDLADSGCTGTSDTSEVNAPVNNNTGGGSIDGGSGLLTFVFDGPTSTTPTAGEGRVLGASTCNPYITNFIKYGKKNNIDDVKRLQELLNEELGISLVVDGRYGPKTMKALKDFQAKYAEKILLPWTKFGLKDTSRGTGYVYKTTKYWINSLKCPDTAPETLTLP